MGRSAALAALLIGAAAVTLTIGPRPMPRLVWNASASVPIGLYRIEPADDLAVSDLVIAMPPPALASFLAERQYLPLGVPLIKHIVALPGRSVCRREFTISVDGTEIGMALAHDRLGRPLPVWQGCRAITKAEVFLMNTDAPASLDGRYFGPIPWRAIVGRAEPFWTFSAQ